MKIATWNVERLKHKRDLEQITSLCEMSEADILVLTETDDRIKPAYGFCYKTEKLHKLDSTVYGLSENRVSVYTNYECIRIHETYDKYESVCVELKAGNGHLLVYGTVIGALGNRDSRFRTDLSAQIADLVRLSKYDLPICFCGDYNLSFGDNYYFTNEGRNMLSEVFGKIDIKILTRDVKECIDHIAVSNGFFDEASVRIREWNQDKKLSDHKGVEAEFTIL